MDPPISARIADGSDPITDMLFVLCIVDSSVVKLYFTSFRATVSGDSVAIVSLDRRRRRSGSVATDLEPTLSRGRGRAIISFVPRLKTSGGASSIPIKSVAVVARESEVVELAVASGLSSEHRRVD